MCRNLADGNHSSEQKEVQATVQKFNAAELILKTTPLIFVIIFLGSWFVCVTMSRNHPCSRCDKGGRKRILILCITGRILATLAVFLSYMLEHLVSPFTWFSHSMPKYYLGCGMALAGHHL